MRSLVALVLAGGLAQAGQGKAGCFSAEELPAKAIYDSGSVLEYLGREGDVLTYRSGPVTTRMKDGLWPLEHSTTDGVRTQYRWDTLLPDLARVIADGGKARVEGRMKQGDQDWIPVAAEVEVLRQDTQDWEDCRYGVVEFRKTVHADGKKVSEGVVVYAPAAMISFRSDAVEVGSGKVYTYRLTELQ